MQFPVLLLYEMDVNSVDETLRRFDRRDKETNN